jgi:hypothetical protein
MVTMNNAFSKSTLPRRPLLMAVVPALLLVLTAAPKPAGVAAAPLLQVTPTLPVARPILGLSSYSSNPYAVEPGQEFDLNFRLGNNGNAKARNIIMTFSSTDFLPRGNGGVVSDLVMDDGASTGYSQPLTATSEVKSKAVGSLVLQVSYVDDFGNPFSASFTLSIPIAEPAPFAGPAWTRTPTPGPRPQLLIRSYSTSTELLSPGSRFVLSIEVFNAGGTAAKRINMILGGGLKTGEESSGGTPAPGAGGGLSGAGGDFSTFAPVGSSNVQFLGDLGAGVSMKATQQLIVNGTAKAGAFPVKFSFTYNDERGASLTDDQVITLLVYTTPLLEVGYYREPDPLFSGQPGTLPIQVVNLGHSTVILGLMEVQGTGAQLSNNRMMIGPLDPGGYFTLDPMVMAEQIGVLDLTVAVHYLDDFNQAQVIEQHLSVPVEAGESFPGPGPIEGPPPGEGVSEPALPETLWQKVTRLVLGFLGLDGGARSPGGSLPEGVPGEKPPQGPIVVPAGPKG